MKEKGSISINVENIFPIIKKFLYSDHEIFLREIVSNAVDACQKLQKLASMGEYKNELGEMNIEVKVSKENKTITISDKGVGMTAEEIKKYINQVAFSGAKEFIEKYKQQGEGTQIIGMFGLGFYSAFMVSKRVEIITKSYKDDQEAILWTCDGSTEFEISKATKPTRGTDVILHIDDDSEEFLQEHKIGEILQKYCNFLPIPIIFGEKEVTEKDEKGKEIKVKKANTINNPSPIWVKSPSSLKDEDYLQFYKELYPYSEPPLFWVHLNVDYPFNLTGILYFPRIKDDLNFNRDKIKLFSRQVFITDEVKEIVPEFLTLLHGVLDSPDIPLNVSRSFLQSDSNVKKINRHITKKVADKLEELFKKDRAEFEKKWNDIGMFVKYGIISEENFFERAKKFTLLESIDNKFYTVDEYKKHVEKNQIDKNGVSVYLYTTNEKQQDTAIQSAKKQGYDVLRFDNMIDNHFINNIEAKLEKISWKRVDSASISKLIEKEDSLKESVLSDKEKEKVKKLFEGINDTQRASVQIEPLPTTELPVTVVFPEFFRRMRDMSSMTSKTKNAFPEQYEVVVNANHPTIQKMLKTENEEEQKQLVGQVYELGLLAQNLLTGNRLTKFIHKNIDFINKL